MYSVYGYFVIGYLFGFCCIVELICTKRRSSEINLYYSEMQLELSETGLNYLKSRHLEFSEIGLNYLKFTWKFLKLTWEKV